MLYTQQLARFGSKVGVTGIKLDYRPGEYDSRKRRTLSSVYSPHAVIALVRSVGKCAGMSRQGARVGQRVLRDMPRARRE